MDESDFHAILDSMLQADELSNEESNHDELDETDGYEYSTTSIIDMIATREFWYFTEFADLVRERVARGFYRR